MVSASWFNHYEPNVPHTLTYPQVPLQQFLDDAAHRYPDNIATQLVLKYVLAGRLAIGGSLTYRQLNEYANTFATALIGMNVKPGDRVALMLPNSPQYVIAFYGALKAGAIIVNVDPAGTDQAVHHRLSDSGAETVVLLNLFQKRFAAIKEKTPVRNTIVTHSFDLLPAPAKQLVRYAQQKAAQWIDIQAGGDVHGFEELLRKPRRAIPLPEVRPDDVALLQYTAGTTGTPKAAMLTHKNLVANTLQLIAFLPIAEPSKEKIIAAIPFSHVYGVTAAMNLAIYLGSQMLIIPSPELLDDVMRLISKEQATIFPGVPMIYNRLINHPGFQQIDFQSIKVCISGFAALPVDVQAQFGKRTRGRLVEAYGLTETAGITHCNPVCGERRAGSIGVPLPDVEAKLVNGDTGLPVRWGSNEAGELYVRGPNVMKGYWNQPEETARTIDEDSWLRTGDMARMDENGYFYIVNRVQDIFNVSR